MTVRGVVVSRRTSRTRRPELVICAGPRVLAQPGAGLFADLYGTPWALALYKDGPQLLQLQGETWTERSDPDALRVLVGVSHVSLAFDQAARPVVAWTVRGSVFLRQWDALQAQYVTRGPWAGRESLLICDAVIHGDPTQSDVWLFSLAGGSLEGRIQRETYAAAHLLAEVDPGAVLDQAVAAGGRLLILGETPTGPLSLLSDYYPPEPKTRMTGAVAFTGGVLETLLVSRAVQDNTFSGAVAFTGGLLDSQLLKRADANGLSGAVAFTGGNLAIIGVSRSGANGLSGAVAFTGGTLAIVAISRSNSNGLTGVAAFTGGSI